MARRKSTLRVHRANTVSFELAGDIETQVAAWFDQIKEKALRPAAHQMAVVLHDALRAAVPVGKGTLRSAIYRWYDERQSASDHQTYLVGVNKRKAPHWWIEEHGYWRRFAIIKGKDGQWVTLKDRPLKVPVFVPGQPYFRPTIDAKMPEAVQAGLRRLGEKIQEIRDA
jgi:hypothetical protein